MHYAVHGVVETSSLELGGRNQMTKKDSFHNSAACRWLLIFIALILLFSFCAKLIESEGASIKIERVIIDSRGAAINANLYYPSFTTDKDKLPAVLVAHGGGVNSGVIKGIAGELARRGFVVLNVDAYGAGLSEQPAYDDGGQGIDSFNNQITPNGMLDCLTFIRTLKFVDQNRIGMAGHSMGSRRAQNTANVDCGYYTFNDIMINVLADTFMQTFTQNEISQSADMLAAARLNQDQLAYYKKLEALNRELFDSRLKSICLIGSDAGIASPLKVVKVAGYDVQRNCQVNIGIISGTHDLSYRDYYTRDTTKESWHAENIALETWYSIDDINNTGNPLGAFQEVSVATDQDLKAAIESRTLRICMLNPETHSQNFFSVPTASDTVKFFEQTLSYNRGELTSTNTTALNSNNTVFMWREMFNFLAMLSMIGMITALAALLLKTPFFSVCVATFNGRGNSEINKKSYWLFAAITVALTFLAMYITNTFTPFMFPLWRGLPLFGSFWLTVALIAVLSAGSIILLICYSFISKKKFGDTGLKSLNIRLTFTSFLKSLVLAIILLAAGYLSLILIEYLFNQDYRLWMAAFTELRAEHWALVWRYTLLTLPFFLLIGASTNYTIRRDIPEWKDTLITVIVGSLGIWLCCLINQVLAFSGVLEDALFSSFISTYGMLVIVPITVYISRKMFKLTNSIWLGALLNALLISWTLISSAGMSCDLFYGQTLLSNLLGM